MSEFKKVPTLLDSLPPSWSDSSLLLNKTPVDICAVGSKWYEYKLEYFSLQDKSVSR